MGIFDPGGLGTDPINLSRNIGGEGSPLYQRPFTPGAYTPPSQPLPPAIDPTVTGLTPQDFAAVLYGKSKPLWVGGKSLLGGRIIEGPFFSTVAGDVTASGIAAFCIPANYANDTRQITQVRLSAKEAWNGLANSAGVTETSTPMSGLTVGGSTSGTEQRIRFMFGTNTQSPDASSITRYGADAQSYNPLVCLVFDNIRTAPFGNVVPFFSILLGDTDFGSPDDGITWQYAIETVAAYDGRSAHFEAVGLTGRIDALILGSPSTFPDLITGMRAAKPHWVVQTRDKYLIIEKGPFALDLDLDQANLAPNDGNKIVFALGDALAQPREQMHTFIDSNRDYEPSTVSAFQDPDATPAFKTTNVAVPAVTTAVEALVDVNFAFFYNECARETAEYIANVDYYGIDVGDVQKIVTDARTYFETVTEVVRNPDWTTDVKTQGFLTCGIAQTAYTAHAIVTDTSSDLEQDTSTLSDTSRFTISFWVRIPSTGDVGVVLAVGNGAVVLSVRVAQSQLLLSARTTAGDDEFVVSYATLASTGQWYHAFLSFELDHASGSRVENCYVDGSHVAADIFNDFGSSFAVPMNGASISAAQCDVGTIELAVVQVWTGIAMSPTNISKFISAGEPVDPAVAAAAFGTQTYLFTGDASSFVTNGGTGGAFVAFGSITDAATAP